MVRWTFNCSRIKAKTVANFVALANSYYDMSFFIGLLKILWSKGRSLLVQVWWWIHLWWELSEDEFERTVQYSRALSMANAGPNTNGSQFLLYKINISHIRKRELVRGWLTWRNCWNLYDRRGTPHLDQRHVPYLSNWWSFFAVLDEIVMLRQVGWISQ